MSLPEFLRTLQAFRSLGFEFARLNDLITFLELGQRPTQIHTRMAVITFDDGYASIARSVFPILQAQQIPFVVCAISTCLEGRQMLWTDWVRLLRHAAPGIFEELVGDQDLKAMPNSERKRLLQSCEARLTAMGRRLTVPEAYRPMSLGELKRLHDSGFVEVVFHTRTHPILSTIESEVELEQECSASEADWVTCREAFCIPNGLQRDCGPTVVQVLRRLGYRYLLTAEPGYLTSRSRVEEVPRIVCRQEHFRTVVEAMNVLCRHAASRGQTPSPLTRWMLDVGTRLC